MNNCIGIINLDEDESRISELVRNRPLASIPIAARYRVIDFVLSNMTNSGIECIGIFAKNRSRSLMDHLSNGRPWDLHRKKDGLKVFNFGYEDPAVDDVHNFSDNIEFVKYSRKKYVLISPSYMICNIDYHDAFNQHIQNGNDITIIYKNITNGDRDFYGCEVLDINRNGQVVDVKQNRGTKSDINISMEMYIMNAELFINIVSDSIKSGMYRKIKQYIYGNLNSYKVGVYEFKGYLSCVNSISSYYNTNMDLLKKKINNELFLDNRTIYTKIKDEAPTKYSEKSMVSNSIIANGCLIEGTVKNCVLSRQVHVFKDSIIENCVLMQNVIIKEGAKLINIIADKGAKVEEEDIYEGTEIWPIVMKKQAY